VRAGAATSVIERLVPRSVEESASSLVKKSA
jgi:hypothetical protein